MTGYFTTRELACPCCGRQKFEDGFLAGLGALRRGTGVAMPLTSACRCDPHNRAVRGHKRSLHRMTNSDHDCATIAVDVAMADGNNKAVLTGAALHNGWSVGVAADFIHLDLRTKYLGLQQRLFHYG